MTLRNLETGDPRVHPSKIERGQKFWRWTVVRHAAPEQRPCGRGRLWYQRRVIVRCVCGDEITAWEADLVRGLSTGCRSAKCRRAHDGGVMNKIEESARTIGERLAWLHDQLQTESANLKRLHAESLAITEQSKKRRRSS
jgi:hypothetical protein